MSLDDLANIGEFVGAIGVVVSLLYLARQISQNTKAVWLSAYDRYVAAGVPPAFVREIDRLLSES